ncbi:MAG TPA: nicotinamide mononucleotide transporter [Candidatus Saccharimonadales bacterium]|nr:nicotinamide mononucleotide transporter [Candidatus Saccharimonadales bacterium]
MGHALDIISQVGITLFGVTSIFLVAKKIKWGFIVGLISEPFWYYTTFYHHQWGIFVLNFFYVGSWGLGVYEWFYKKNRPSSTSETKAAKV